MLQTIESALREVQEPVFYGSADDVGNTALWNYIVFFRDRIARNQNNTGYTDYFTVAIIHENWVPDEMIEAAIVKMEALPGFKLANADVSFDYTRKPGTNAVIEVATLTFARARKRV
jgi:hypothetical protein